MSELTTIQFLIIHNSNNQILTSVFKMERDLLGFSKLIELTDKDNFKLFSKEEIMTFIKYLESNLEFLKNVFRNNKIEDIKEIKSITQDIEYCYPVYNLKDDIPYWENTSYLYEGIKNFEQKISKIHNTYFAKTTASAYVNLLKYKFIENNILNHNLVNNINVSEINDWSISNAKENYLKSLHISIAAFFNLYTSVNIIVEKIMNENIKLENYYEQEKNGINDVLEKSLSKKLHNTKNKKVI